MNPLRRRTLRRLLTIGLIVAAVVVVVLLILIASGILVLPSKSPAPVTITYVHLTVIENVTAGGYPWFGPTSRSINFTNGFPLQVAPGKTFSVVWANFANLDSVPHTLNGLSWTTTPAASVTKAATLPALPYTVPAEANDNNLQITFTVPSTPGATYIVNAVLSAGAIS